MALKMQLAPVDFHSDILSILAEAKLGTDSVCFADFNILEHLVEAPFAISNSRASEVNSDSKALSQRHPVGSFLAACLPQQTMGFSGNIPI
jgi:hypothetical protein